VHVHVACLFPHPYPPPPAIYIPDFGFWTLGHLVSGFWTSLRWLIEQIDRRRGRRSRGKLLFQHQAMIKMMMSEAKGKQNNTRVVYWMMVYSMVYFVGGPGTGQVPKLNFSLDHFRRGPCSLFPVAGQKIPHPALGGILAGTWRHRQWGKSLASNPIESKRSQSHGRQSNSTTVQNRDSSREHLAINL